MYRINEIVNAFSSLVGWRDSETLSASTSGLYFEDAHPLLTYRAMESIMPAIILDRLPEYDVNHIYSKGDIVKSNGKAYKSLIDNNNRVPIDISGWSVFSEVELYLAQLRDGGIKKVITRFVSDKLANVETKNIVERRTLFDGVGRKEAAIPNRGRLVGFEFVPLKANGITTELNKIGLQFVGNVGTIKLYLFHSSVAEPIAVKEVEYTSARGSFMWFDLEGWVMPYVSENTNAGGAWYVVYDESALPSYMQSINFGRDWSREPCGTCNKGDAMLYRTMVRNITLSPFYVAVDDWDETLWDIDDMQYTSGYNYGLNFMVTMSCDLTSAIIAEKSVFAPAIQLQVATDALRALAMNPDVNVNRVQVNADRNDIMFAVEGNGQGVRGIQGDLDKAMKALSVDTKGLDDVCLGCHNKGVRYLSI